jgi:hypothetical protein
MCRWILGELSENYGKLPMAYSYLLIKVNPMTDKNIDLKLVKVGRRG